MVLGPMMMMMMMMMILIYVKETSQKAFQILHKMLGLNRGTLVLRAPDGTSTST